VHKLIVGQTRRAAFLDRDGVINVDKGYVSCWEDFEYLPMAISGMRNLLDGGYVLVIVTNQSGIARGYYTAEQYSHLEKAILRDLSLRGIPIAGSYHCPHHPHEGIVQHLSRTCDCRKPLPGMIVRAANELNLSLRESIIIGDKYSDIAAGSAAGLKKTFLISRNDVNIPASIHQPDGVFHDIDQCSRFVLDQ
jgi:D-glycero-D-manno-heptose 1,7-bisphosphate phosphatase